MNLQTTNLFNGYESAPQVAKVGLSHSLDIGLQWILHGWTTIGKSPVPTPPLAMASKHCYLCHWTAISMIPCDYPLSLKMFLHVFWSLGCLKPAQVYEVKFWMMLWGSSSPKPSMFMSNMRSISGLYAGKLTAAEKAKRHKVKTTRNLLHVFFFSCYHMIGRALCSQ